MIFACLLLTFHRAVKEYVSHMFWIFTCIFGQNKLLLYLYVNCNIKTLSYSKYFIANNTIKIKTIK